MILRNNLNLKEKEKLEFILNAKMKEYDKLISDILNKGGSFEEASRRLIEINNIRKEIEKYEK